MLRGAVREDISRIYEIEKLSFSCPWSEKAVRDSVEESLENSSVIVKIWETEEIEGFVIYSLVCGEGEIYDIAVDPKFRRRGVGEKLLEETLKDCERAFLEVRESNLPAIGLYEKMGFKGGGLRKKYYSDGENALVMIYERTCENGSDIGD